MTFFAFDLMFVDGTDLRARPLKERRERLREVLAHADGERIRFSEALDEGVESLLDSACRMGLEGLIGKRFDRPYTEGRSSDWIKAKCFRRQEFVVGGIKRTKGAGAGIRSLLLGVYERDGSFRYAGSVKPILGPAQIRDLEARLEPVGRPPFFNPPGSERDRDIVWLQPQVVVEVAFLEWTSSGDGITGCGAIPARRSVTLKICPTTSQ